MRYRYTKYHPGLIDEIDMEDLMSKLSDLLLSSGFGDGMGDPFDGDHTMQALHDVVKSGKARYIGASSMFAWQFATMQHEILPQVI